MSEQTRPAGSGTVPVMQISEDQKRLLGACLAHPARIKPCVEAILNNGAGLHPALREIYQAIDPMDPAIPVAEVALRLGGEEGLRNLLEGIDANPANWLLDTALLGERYDEAGATLLARSVAEDHRRRDARITCRGLIANLDDPSKALDGVLDESMDTIRGLRARSLEHGQLEAEFLGASKSYGQLLADKTPRPPSVLGDGLLSACQIGQIHGEDGVGKSWATLQLLIAAATGKDWFGIPTRSGGIPCGLVSLEDDLWILRDRLSAIVLTMGADEERLDRNLHLICPPHFNKPWDLTDPVGRNAIKAWIKAHSLLLAIVDHLSKAHALSDERDLRPVSNAALEVARECICGVLFNHHDRKAPAGSVNKFDRGASRGDSRFAADCRLRIALKGIGDRIQLTVEKSTARAKPEPIWLVQDPGSGVLAVTDAPAKPADQKAGRMSKALEAIRAAGSRGLAPLDLAQAIGVAERTVRDYASKLEERGLIRKVGRTNATRYLLRQTEQRAGDLPEMAQYEE